ncbi:MAG TPA: hypothetical protein VGD24_06545 [Gallionella sp.]
MTRLLLCLLLGVLAACGSAPAPRLPAAQEQAIAADRNARRALREGQLHNARNGFATALRLQQSLDDTHAAAMTLINLATVTHQLGDDVTALSLLDRILLEKTGIYPPESHLTATFRKSVILTDLDRLSEAESSLKSAEALCGQNCAVRPSIEVLQARLLVLKGDAEGALALAQPVSTRRAVGKEEQANAMRVMAVAEERLARYEAALQHFTAALEMDKALGLSARIGDDLGGMARTAEKLGKAREAKAYARRAALVNESQQRNNPAVR